MDKNFTDELRRIAGGWLQTDISLKSFSYLKTGGRAAHFITLSDEIIIQEEGKDHLQEKTLNRLQAVINFLVKTNKPYQVIGKGSNIIIKDGVVDPVVINFQLNQTSCWQELREYPNHPDMSLLKLPASCTLIRAIKIAFDNKLQGLEFYMGIPGSIGGAVVMNAGVKERETKDVLNKVTLLRSGTIQNLGKDSLDLRYRHSNISTDEIVIQAEFQLKKIDPEGMHKLKKQTLNELEIRKKTQPLTKPSVGSTFKNPLPEYAGALIERCGLKNYHYGGIRVSPVHANFIINDGSGTSSQAWHLIETIQDTVFSQTGIRLELEVRKFGF